MIAPETELAPQEQMRPEFDEDHTVCCLNENLTLCGIDASGFEWMGDFSGPASCVVCADLEHTGFCPLGKGECPP